MKNDFNKVYKNYDEFIEAMNDPVLLENMAHLEQDFLGIEKESKRYCSAPPSYRDPKVHKQKKHNKVYYQFIKENYDLLQSKYTHLLEKYPVINQFLQGMLQVDQMAKQMFTVVLDQMSLKCPGIKEVFYGNHNELTVLTKIVRYEKTEKWGTTAHFDKSGLTFIWDSNDEDDDSLLTCADVLMPSLDSLIKPNRFYAHKMDFSSTILIAGSAFSKVGINIKPTLHGVAPIKKDYRHAIISFLLIPDIDMSDLKTDFV